MIETAKAASSSASTQAPQALGVKLERPDTAKYGRGVAILRCHR